MFVPAAPPSDHDDDEDSPPENVMITAFNFPEMFLQVLCARGAKNQDPILRLDVVQTIHWGNVANIPRGDRFYQFAAE